MADTKHLKGLTQKETAFVLAYSRISGGGNATRCYAEAYGYDLDGDDSGSYGTCSVEGCKLLKLPKIQKAIEIEKSRQIANHDHMAKFVMEQWAKAASADLLSAYEVEGGRAIFKNKSDIPKDLRAAVVGIKNVADGVEVKFMDKNKCLDSMARALGMFVDKTQNVNEEYESIIQRIAKQDD